MHRLRSGRLALTLALAIAFAAAFEVFTADVTVSSPALEEGIAYRQVQPCGRTGLTMNVDWGEEELPKILDLLKERNVKITFFVSGKWAEKNPKLLRRMYIEGHEIGSHGYGHKLCSQISTEQIREELEKTEQAIEPLLDGEQLSLFAPPSGDYDEKTVDLCRELGYKLTLWSADTIDWKEGSTAEVITKRVLKKNLDGAIVLMHPKPETVKALPQILDGIEEKGLVPGRLYDLEIY
ncbi:MAG: polysaccharide deacetylase family protein [Firmicutes bacterium]|nr:polysaccharide deacetylase family protein [Bacillota bacterium]MBR4073909.1 polysaccharide deacetylase family protein [Bacillota bacterium]